MNPSGPQGDTDDATEVPAGVRGWFHHPEDPPGVSRWFTGRAWTNQLTGGTEQERSRAVVVAATSRRQPAASLPPEGDPVAVLPSVASTILVTLFLGPFGVAPAAAYSALACQAGRPTPKYWAAFALTLASLAVIVWVVAFVVP